MLNSKSKIKKKEGKIIKLQSKVVKYFDELGDNISIKELIKILNNEDSVDQKKKNYVKKFNKYLEDFIQKLLDEKEILMDSEHNFKESDTDELNVFHSYTTNTQLFDEYQKKKENIKELYNYNNESE